MCWLFKYVTINPAHRNDLTTCTRYTHVLSESVFSLGWTSFVYLCKASAMSMSRFYLLFRHSLDLCFIESMWFFTMLFFTESSTRHSPVNSCTRSWGEIELSLEQTEPPLDRLWSTGGVLVEICLFWASSKATGNQSLSRRDALAIKVCLGEMQQHWMTLLHCTRTHWHCLFHLLCCRRCP